MDPEALDQLAVAAQTGDEQAFSDLVRATEGEVRAFVCARAANLGMIEEVLQTTFVTAYTQLAKYEPRRTLLPWLKGIARNHLSEELRRMRRLQPLHADVAEQGMLAACATAVDEDEQRSGELDRLRICLERLTPRIRRLLELRYWQGLSVEELAVGQQQSANATAALLYRARKALSACLAGGETA
jgi:RNA polymerase sigma-70 factor (ECF subfamily)